MSATPLLPFPPFADSRVLLADAVIAAAGGKNVLIYNDASALTYIPSGSSYGLDSVAIVSAEDGAALLAISQSSALVSADKATVVSVDYESAGKISDFSSYGPNWELDGPSPAFSGPGGNILSTWPLEDGGYSIASGTSMAAPAIAGGVSAVGL
jgi:subtilisin family serine protease